MTTKDTSVITPIEVTSDGQNAPSYASRTSWVTITIAAISHSRRISRAVLR